MIAMTIFVFLLAPVSYTFAQMEGLEQNIEIEESTTEEIETEISEIVKPSISPISILVSLIGMSLFLSLGYILIKRFNL